MVFFLLDTSVDWATYRSVKRHSRQNSVMGHVDHLHKETVLGGWYCQELISIGNMGEC